MPYFQDLGPSLQKGGIKISLQAYVSLTLLMTGLSFFATLGSTFLVAGLLGVPLLITALFAFAVGIVSGVGTFGLIYGLPGFLASNRAKRMDLELPYVASHLSILATAGLPPARMFKLIEDSATTPQVASEANEITRDVEVLGQDIITALEAERVRSPSKTFAEMLEGFVATIRSGGSLTGYLQDATTGCDGFEEGCREAIGGRPRNIRGSVRNPHGRFPSTRHRNVLGYVHNRQWPGRVLNHRHDDARHLPHHPILRNRRHRTARHNARGGLSDAKD